MVGFLEFILERTTTLLYRQAESQKIQEIKSHIKVSLLSPNEDFPKGQVPAIWTEESMSYSENIQELTKSGLFKRKIIPLD